MALKISKESPAKGFSIIHTEDEKFNVEAVIVRFIVPNDELMSPRYSLLMSLMTESCAAYPSRSALEERLYELYGAYLHSFSYRAGDLFVCGMTINSIIDANTLDGESVTTDCAKLLLDCIFDPNIKDGRLDEQDFEIKKRERINRIKRTADDRHLYALRRSYELAFEGEPAAIDPLGKVEQVEALTNEEVAACYSELMKSAYISISFTGAGQGREAQKLIRDCFVRFSEERGYSGIEIEDYLEPSPIKPEVKRITEQISQQQLKLVMVYKIGKKISTAHRVMSTMLGGPAFSKLFVNVREKLSLCYYCQSRINDVKGTLIIDSGVAAGKEERAQEEIIAQIKDLQNGIFTDEDLENTKKYQKSALRAIYDYCEDINDWCFTMFLTSEDLSPDAMFDKLDAVTREDVIAAARDLKPDTVYILEPEDGGKGEADE